LRGSDINLNRRRRGSKDSDFAAPFTSNNELHGDELPPVLNGMRCAFCDGPAGKSYLCSRGRAVCGKKKCRFALAREGK
jgi:hypothetical protein